MSTLSKKLMLCLCLLPLLLPGRLLVPAQLDHISATRLVAVDPTQQRCLARNIYHESRGEPFWGQVAVAQVTLNRVRSREYQNTVCGVVYQRAQFSWTLDHTKRVRDTKAWHEANLIAHGVLSGRIKLPNFHALYYHTHKVKPRWSKTKQVVATIGNHIFYN